MALVICILVIVGLACMVNYGESQKRIRIHGYDWLKDDSKRTQAENDFILKKRQDEEIMKTFNLMQQGLKYREHQIKVHIAEHGMTEEAISELGVCIMSLDAFQEYADSLPAHLKNELMNAAKKEAMASARRRVSKDCFYKLDEIAEIKKHKTAFAELFNVVNKCRQYEESGNDTLGVQCSNQKTVDYENNKPLSIYRPLINEVNGETGREKHQNKDSEEFEELYVLDNYILNVD